MNIELTDEQRTLLLEVLEEKQTRMIQEIDHTDARDFEELLRQKLEMLEIFKRKLEASPLLSQSTNGTKPV